LSHLILSKYKTLSNLIFSDTNIIQDTKGIGRAKKALLIAIRELILRVKLSEFQTKDSLDRKSLFEYLYWITNKETRECFYLICFDSHKKVQSIKLLAKGSLEEVGVHLRDLVKVILDSKSLEVIISHNHPNDSSKPSEADFHVYNRLKDFLAELEVSLLDQWILGVDGIYSCSKKRKIFKIKKNVTHKSKSKSKNSFHLS
jgi:DNA repair protein RadC